MNARVIETDVQEYIIEHADDNVQRIALSKSPFSGVTPAELAQQIDGLQRSRKKLPSWQHSSNIYYPSKLALEQCSSEQTAAYKASLLPGGTLTDLTGGLGVDSYAFAQNHSQVTHVEVNTELSEIAMHNALQFGYQNITFMNTDAITYLESTGLHFDTIYIDPARRLNSSRVFRLADCQPDVTRHIDLLFARTSRILIKTSPLLDIRAGLSELRNVKSVHVISVGNECKELLWLLEKDHTGEPEIHAVLLSRDIQYQFNLNDEATYESVSYSEPLNYLYEPDAAVLKAGSFKLLCRDYPVYKLEKNSHLYTSTELVNNFPGKIFAISKTMPYGDFTRLKESHKANVTARNFHLKAEELVKKHKISSSDKHFLVFTKTPKGLTVVFSEVR